MLFNYKALDQAGRESTGAIDAINVDVAINSLQRRGLVLSSITPEEKRGFLNKSISLFDRVSSKQVVILSRQLATLFEAQVSALRVFRLLSSETENAYLGRLLQQVADDIQGGSSIAKALAKHPKAFSSFYVNMVRAGEESGKLSDVFLYLADYLDRTYEVTSKAKNALIYPAFVVVTFAVVMILMFTLVIPNISGILLESGQDIPIYTKIVIGISEFFVHYGIYLFILICIGAGFLVRYVRTPIGAYSYSRFKLAIPYIGTLYKKLYLSRIADNMNTMLLSAIPIVKAIEITADVVENHVYEEIMNEALTAVKGGSSLSDALGAHFEIPGIMSQMVKVGEETGEMGEILKSMANFYRREVQNAVDTLVSLIEPAMIVFLGVGVAILLAAVLIPIYNISAAI
ncbi:MAG: hypothetical protein A2928_02535 [Candidatus Taylorbacteria bacterium RIFCSPLOWO2_01_FULL_45_15b]|uniref:Type II secretion system protein GspF domain-containing protein n=1 Tax=Candidatus Taylorbacteria bacterium RIFCSPLOWO2_01_FULL_45_15b TaxID=1802319 RepID=A0A1G2NCC9_9BACT|nr:MAG: hypothetical protein A2928_02535 [Candidatus Taylorbacteria bacterium RIFCSPLOWO2_01_FULL_45_15b]